MLVYIKKPLFIDVVRLRWLDIGLVLFSLGMRGTKLTNAIFHYTTLIYLDFFRVLSKVTMVCKNYCKIG